MGWVGLGHTKWTPRQPKSIGLIGHVLMLLWQNNFGLGFDLGLGFVLLFLVWKIWPCSRRWFRHDHRLGWIESQQHINLSAESAYCGDCASVSFCWTTMALNHYYIYDNFFAMKSLTKKFSKQNSSHHQKNPNCVSAQCFTGLSVFYLSFLAHVLCSSTVQLSLSRYCFWLLLGFEQNKNK